MFIDTGLKVYDVLVGKMRRFEIADVESEAIEEQTEAGMGQLTVSITKVDAKFTTLLLICEEIAE